MMSYADLHQLMPNKSIVGGIYFPVKLRTLENNMLRKEDGRIVSRRETAFPGFGVQTLEYRNVKGRRREVGPWDLARI